MKDVTRRLLAWAQGVTIVAAIISLARGLDGAASVLLVLIGVFWLLLFGRLGPKR